MPLLNMGSSFLNIQLLVYAKMNTLCPLRDANMPNLASGTQRSTSCMGRNMSTELVKSKSRVAIKLLPT